MGKTLLGIDYGTKNVGLAVGDTDSGMAVPSATFPNDKYLMESILTVIEEQDIHAIVLGLPVNLQGEDNEMTPKVKNFYKDLKESVDIPIELQDERLTSRMVENIRKSKGLPPKKNIDALAAMVILENFLERTGDNRG